MAPIFQALLVALLPALALADFEWVVFDVYPYSSQEGTTTNACVGTTPSSCSTWTDWGGCTPAFVVNEDDQESPVTIQDFCGIDNITCNDISGGSWSLIECTDDADGSTVAYCSPPDNQDPYTCTGNINGAELVTPYMYCSGTACG